MALTDAERLRQLLGESIPAGGSETDTMFTDEEIDDFISEAADAKKPLYMAAALGWEVKAANYAGLVNVTEGNSAREMSDLYKHAESRIAYFKSVAGVKERVRIGRIVRSGG